MAAVSIKLNNNELKAGIAALGKKFPGRVWRAVKRTGTAATTLMAKEMRKDTGLPSKQIKLAFKKEPIKPAGRPVPSGIRLIVTGRRIPLIAFKARELRSRGGKGRGVSYRLPGGRNRAPRAFIATIGGRRGVFQRKGLARTPTTELKGPSLVRVFGKYLPMGAERAREALLKNLRHEIEFAQKGG